MKIAIICPSKDMTCGIGNYSKSLVDTLKNKAEVLYSNEVNSKVFEFAPDMVNFQWEYGLYDTASITRILNILRKKGICTSITLHGWSDYDTKNKIVETMFDRYIVLNEGFKKHLIKRGITKPIHVIPLGMHSYELSDEDRMFARDILGIHQNEPVVGAFGFLETYKNFRTIMEALAEIKMGMLLLCSYSKDNNSAADLQQLASRLGVKYIRLAGYMSINSVVKVLNACDAIVYPYVDVFTYSSSAALRTGINSLSPVIANDITFFDDVPDVAEKGPVYKVKNSLGEAIKTVLMDKTLRRSLIENAQTYIKINSWDTIADKYLQVVG